jgi:hypothetical protein
MLNVEVDQLLANIVKTVAPLWPLRDYVAVNPFLGLADQRFLDAYRQIRSVRDCEMLASRTYYERMILDAKVTPDDLEAALKQCAEEYPGWFDGITSKEVIAHIVREPGSVKPEQEQATDRLYFTLAEVIDRVEGGDWSSHIINDVTRHCAAHFDQGQAAWQSPWKNLPLYTAWRRSASINPRMDMLGMKGYRKLVAELPPSPQDAIVQLLNKLGVPKAYWSGVLLSQLMSVAGWASYVKYAEQEKTPGDHSGDDLIALIAIRLAYDVALAFSGHIDLSADAVLAEALPQQPGIDVDSPPSKDVLIRYAMQVTAEVAYRRETLSEMRCGEIEPETSTRKAVQMVFCIDVRSEVMRRHLESLDTSIETLGFAGFFGVPIEHVELGETQGDAHCPVLLKPTIQANSCAHISSDQSAAVQKAHHQKHWSKTWKQFKTSAASCFSFVESVGLLYAAKLVSDTFLKPLQAESAKQGDCTTSISLHKKRSHPSKHAPDFTLEDKVALCSGILKNLGLQEGFARVVAICGHVAEVVNNPYKAGLACGACGGHSGAPNARVAAALLNDPEVRTGLAEQGSEIPKDTWFLPAVHNTTTDQITLLDLSTVPASHQDDVNQLKEWIGEAGKLSRAERSDRLAEPDGEKLSSRSRDWSEVRPEWGLAGNAAFIVAPRHRTKGLNLGGKVFMHNYDPAKDADLSVLELILTAPMIVTSWINLQYYASAVDNKHFGSGTKTLHNVVGNFGVLSGNGGDLMTGLPWQSVHDGQKLQHDPLRLLVIVENSREALDTVINKHPNVRALVENGWLTIAAIEDGQTYRRLHCGAWLVEEAATEMSFA